MNEFLESIIRRDPAAKSKLSVIFTYPGIKAVFFHRIANFLAIAKFELLAGPKRDRLERTIIGKLQWKICGS